MADFVQKLSVLSMLLVCTDLGMDVILEDVLGITNAASIAITRKNTPHRPHP